MILETERLRFEPLGAADAAFALDLLNDPGFLSNIGDREVRTLEQAERYVLDVFVASYAANGYGLWRVDLKATGEAVGICGLVKRDWLEDADIGFAYLKRFWGRGYAAEAARATMAYARDTLGMTRVVGIVSPHNLASMAVLEKVGLTFAGEVTAPGKTEPTHLFAPQ